MSDIFKTEKSTPTHFCVREYTTTSIVFKPIPLHPLLLISFFLSFTPAVTLFVFLLILKHTSHNEKNNKKSDNNNKIYTSHQKPIHLLYLLNPTQ